MQGGHATGAAVKDVRAEAWSKWPQEKGGGKAERRGAWERLRAAGHDHQLSITSSSRFNAHPAGEPVLCESNHGRWDSGPPVCRNTNTAATTASRESVCHISCKMNPFLALLDGARKGLLNTKVIYSFHNVSNSASTSERPGLGPSFAIGLWGAADKLAFKNGMCFYCNGKVGKMFIYFLLLKRNINSVQC